MKYFNKTRTIEEKGTDREILFQLGRQTELLESILVEIRENKKWYIDLKREVIVLPELKSNNDGIIENFSVIE